MEIHTLSVNDVKDTATSTARAIPIDQIDATFKSKYIDLISAPLNSHILSFSNEFFAPATNLLNPKPPIRRHGFFVHTGAWYDGWETRRHNPAPYDWVVIRLGVASGTVAGVEIDTAFFDGNHAPEVEVQGTYAPEGDDEVGKEGYTGWESVLPKQECGPSRRHAWALNAPSKPYTHVRLLMYPDGGIARFRLYGTALPVFPAALSAVIELSATVMGGVATSCSDEHFGTKDNLLLPGRGVDMGDGWETKRTRGEHVDWVVVRLGAVGEIDHVVIDTAHFRGNFPKGVRVFAAEGEGEPSGDGDEGWTEVLAEQKTEADREHVFGEELVNVKGRRYGWVKLVIIPDGGVKRFRVFGARAV